MSTNVVQKAALIKRALEPILRKDNTKFLEIIKECFNSNILEPKYKVQALCEYVFDKSGNNGVSANNILLAKTEFNKWINQPVLRLSRQQRDPTTQTPIYILNIFKKYLGINNLAGWMSNNITPDDMNKIGLRVNQLVNKFYQTNKTSKIIRTGTVPQGSAGPASSSGFIDPAGPRLLPEDMMAPRLKGTTYITEQVSFQNQSAASRPTGPMGSSDQIRLNKLIEAFERFNSDTVDKIFEEDKIRIKELLNNFEHDSQNPIIGATAQEANVINLWGLIYHNYKQFADSLKIRGQSISLVASRAILQGYIAGLVIRAPLVNIFRTIFAYVSKQTSKYYVSINDIYNSKNNSPSTNVENLINTILKNIDKQLPPNMVYILMQWEELKHPKLDISCLLNFINLKASTPGAAFKAKFDLESYYKEHPRLTVEKFKTPALNIIKKAGIKITLNEVVSQLRVQGSNVEIFGCDTEHKSPGSSLGDFEEEE